MQKMSDIHQPLCVCSSCFRKCHAYMSVYWNSTFIEGGNRWKCSMCNLSNEVPSLFDWNQQTNQPADRWQRSELNHAVVDFVAPTEYMVRPPQPPVYVFLIDISYGAIHSGQQIALRPIWAQLSDCIQAWSLPQHGPSWNLWIAYLTKTTGRKYASSDSIPPCISFLSLCVLLYD